MDAHAIEQQVISQKFGTTWRWTDPVSGRLREVDRGPRGKIHSEDVRIGTRLVSVDYDGRTWIASPEPTGYPYIDPAMPPVKTARMYRDRIASHEARIIGQTTLRGERVIHVRRLETIPPPTPQEYRQEIQQILKQERKHLPKGVHLPAGFLTSAVPKIPTMTEHIKVDAWLDASTYLPVRVVTVSDGKLTSDETDTWLLRDVTNLAKTRVVIPSGFAHEKAEGTGYGFFFSLTFTRKTKPLPCQAP